MKKKEKGKYINTDNQFGKTTYLCIQCEQLKEKSCYSNHQLKFKHREDKMCKECTQELLLVNEDNLYQDNKIVCAFCKENKSKNKFNKSQLMKKEEERRC